ncbi:tyrosine-type recombinase/integrase [Curtobacterium poinsettiae]|uniref:tyrosine-type recombinase/integrase n=1 Tax=Curtobacterium poinsettiae TaxID=159612 RepID=UPI00217CCFC2|nr:site-specific integrase [Curtobacterium flaccumfaciens]MCS6563440.1 site-specific integrase [Curtobacterium flaccumfaciens pv. poinsettiae]
MADRTFRRKGDAVQWEAEQRRTLSLGDFVDPKAGSVALGDVVDRWIASREHSVSGKTWETESYALPRHVPKALMNRPIASIRTADLNALWGDLLETLAPATVVRFRGMMSSVFAYAMGERLVAKSPVTDSRVPRGRATAERDEIYPFSLAELHEVADAVEAEHSGVGPVVRVLGLSGLRWGELVALRVRDVQMVPYPAFRVSRSASDNQPVRNTTKGGKARTVPIPHAVVNIVKPLLAGRNPDDFLFVSPTGKRLNGPNWKRSVKWDVLNRGRRVHDLRHTAATIWLSQGVDLKTVQAWLGHASATLTADTYAHWMGTDADAAALARLNTAYGDHSGTSAPNLGTVTSL